MSKLTVLSVLEIPDKMKITKKPRTLQENLFRCYDKQLFVDAEIKVQGRTFKAHKSILAFYSPLFQKAFYGIKIPSSLCIINDINPGGFDILLRFLYSSEIPDQASADNLIDACGAAQILLMSGIKEKLINCIFCNTKAKNLHKPIVEEKFWSLLQKSHSRKLRELEERLLQFAENHNETVLNHSDFVKADCEIIKLVLKKMTLSVSESDKLERIAHWKDSNSNLELLDLEVGGLLSYINFERIAPKEFYFIVSKHQNIIPGYDALDILMHLVDPTACSLPCWCTIDNKHINIPVDLSVDKGTLNLEEWPRTDKFKSLEDLRKMSNLNSISEGSKVPIFKSSKDLRKLDDSKTLEGEKEMKFNIEATSYNKNLSRSFYQMLEEGLFTDVTLFARDESKIPAHRLVLALGSEVFADMLYGPTPLNTLRLRGTKDVLKTMLRYFYAAGDTKSAKTAPTRLDSVLRELDVALEYDCHPLIQVCRNVLVSTSMTPYAFWTLLDQENKLKNCKVNTECLIKYALNSPKKVFDHEGFYRAPKNSLVHILESDFLNMLESDILEYVARWLEINATKCPTDCSRKELLKYIRFEAFNPEQFFAFAVQHENLLPKEDAFAILTFLIRDPKENSLPGWCYCGPLRSLFYDRFSKIGTDILIPWKKTSEKGRNIFSCTYIVTISKGIKESKVQYLEIAWNTKPTKQKGIVSFKGNISVKQDGSEPLTFNYIQTTPHLRLIVPVFFTLDTQNPKIRFHIEVNSVHCRKYFFIKEKKMIFDNVVIEAMSGRNCVSDAIVDNFTSERIKIPKYLLPQSTDEAVPTEECFKIITEKTD